MKLVYAKKDNKFIASFPEYYTDEAIKYYLSRIGITEEYYIVFE